MSDNANISWLYQKAYYQGYGFRNVPENTQVSFFDQKNKEIYAKSLATQNLDLLRRSKDPEAEGSFQLITGYPGLISGTGLGHETKSKGESKLGFSFDYTTGVPYLPASSIKGCLRSMFPQKVNKQKANKLDPETMAQHCDFISSILKEILKGDGKIEEIDFVGIKKAYLTDTLKIPAGLCTSIEEDLVDLLELEMFEGIFPSVENSAEGDTVFFKPRSVYQRDIFWDAFPAETLDSKGQFLGPDFITPHKNPYADPVPILFLKILPEVTLQFQFDLKDGIIKKEQKVELFKAILGFTGIGAKTNVGYGQLEEVVPPKAFTKGELIEGTVKNIYHDRLEAEIVETGQIHIMKQGSRVLDQYEEDKYYQFKVGSITLKSEQDTSGQIKFINPVRPIKPLKK